MRKRDTVNGKSEKKEEKEKPKDYDVNERKEKEMKKEVEEKGSDTGECSFNKTTYFLSATIQSRAMTLILS